MDNQEERWFYTLLLPYIQRRKIAGDCMLHAQEVQVNHVTWHEAVSRLVAINMVQRNIRWTVVAAPLWAVSFKQKRLAIKLYREMFTKWKEEKGWAPALTLYEASDGPQVVILEATSGKTTEGDVLRLHS